MSTHQFVKSDGIAYAVTMIGQQKLNAVEHQLSLVQPVGGTQALAAGPGHLASVASSADFLIRGGTRSAARLAMWELYDFALNSVWLERLLPDGSVTPEARLVGGGESVASKKVTPLSATGKDFKVTLAFNATSPGVLWAYVVDANGDGIADANGDVLIGLAD